MHLVMKGARGLKGKQYATLLALAHYADEKTGECWPSRQTISSMARQSLRSTIWALATLETSGWITIDRQAGERGCNLYTLNLAQLKKSVRAAHESDLAEALAACAGD